MRDPIGYNEGWQSTSVLYSIWVRCWSNTYHLSADKVSGQLILEWTGVWGLNSPCWGFSGSHPGQCIPSNQPTSICLDLSLGASILYLPITSTLTTTPLSIVGTSGHMPSCVGSMVVTCHELEGVSQRGSRVSPVIWLQWICLANHVLWVFSGRCHTLRKGRLHLAWMMRAWLGWCDPWGVIHVGLSVKWSCHVGTSCT